MAARSLAGIGAARPRRARDTLSFLVSAALPADAFEASRAGAVLVHAELWPRRPRGPGDPDRGRRSRTRALVQVLPPRSAPSPSAAGDRSDRAVWAPGVVLGDDVSIGPHVVLGRDVRLGRPRAARTPGVVIEDGVVIGDDSRAGMPAWSATPGDPHRAAGWSLKAGAVHRRPGLRVSSRGPRARADPPRRAAASSRTTWRSARTRCVDRGSIDDTVIGHGHQDRQPGPRRAQRPDRRALPADGAAWASPAAPGWVTT